MRSLILAMIVAAGCSHDKSPSDVDAPPGYVEITCDSDRTNFPALDKACNQASDCFIAQHQIDCCGTFDAIGFNVASQSTFATAETACEAKFPGCGCASRPTMAEDGRSQAQGTIAVRCEDQRCQTYVP